MNEFILMIYHAGTFTFESSSSTFPLAVKKAKKLQRLLNRGANNTKANKAKQKTYIFALCSDYTPLIEK